MRGRTGVLSETLRYTDATYIYCVGVCVGRFLHLDADGRGRGNYFLGNGLPLRMLLLDAVSAVDERRYGFLFEYGSQA